MDADPEFGSVLFNLATLVVDHKNDFGEAEALYRRYLDIDEDDEDVLHNLGKIVADHKHDMVECQKNCSSAPHVTRASCYRPRGGIRD